MIKRENPTTTQANVVFFITVLATLAGSVILMPRLGMGTNLWINEFIYILFPALLLAGLNRWNLEKVYRYRRASKRNKIIGIFSGIGIWFFASYVSKIISSLLNNGVGVIKAGNAGSMSLNQQILILIGMVILAPICEETLFRGFIQRAYENRSGKYGFVITAILFGSFHILNGLSEVIPATVIGLVLGYLVYRTGSISTSILAHAANNLSSIAGGALGLTTFSDMPLWLHFVSMAALGVIILLLRGLKAESHDEADNEVQAIKKHTPV